MNSISLKSIVLALLVFLTGCSSSSIWHGGAMRGQVVRAEGDVAVVCIGSKDRVQLGAEFDAYEFRYQGAISEGTDNYSRHKVGVVRITEVIDAHFARAKIVSGKVESRNMVELGRD